MARYKVCGTNLIELQQRLDAAEVEAAAMAEAGEESARVVASLKVEVATAKKEAAEMPLRRRFEDFSRSRQAPPSWA